MPSTSYSGSVSVSWTASSTGGGAATPQGYYVTRTNTLTSATANACGTTPPPSPTLTTSPCNDTGVSPGTYTYTVTALFNSWTATSARSSPVTVLGHGSQPDERAPSARPESRSPPKASPAHNGAHREGRRANATITSGGTTDGTGGSTVTFIIPAVPNGQSRRSHRRLQLGHLGHQLHRDAPNHVAVETAVRWAPP